MPRATTMTNNDNLVQLDKPTAARFRSSCFESCVRDFLNALRPLKNGRKRDVLQSVRVRAYIDLLQRALINAEELYATTVEKENLKRNKRALHDRTA